MKVEFIRVISTRGTKPGVHAIVDDYTVRWNPGPGWRCQCTDWNKRAPRCLHIKAASGLLSPRVTEPTTNTPKRNHEHH